MKTYLKFFEFAKPVMGFLIPFFLLTTFSTIFGVVNLALLIPLLESLFGTPTQEGATILSQPEFELSVSYLRDLFYYHFEKITIENDKYAALQFVCLIIIASTLLSNLFKYASIQTMIGFKLKVVLNIRNRIYEKLVGLHLSYFTHTKKGDIISKVLSDTIQMESALTSSLSVFIKEPIRLIAILTVLFSLSMELTLLTLTIVPISGLFISLIIKRLRKEANEGQKSLGRMISILDETIGGMKIIMSFTGFEFMINKFRDETLYYNRKLKSLTKRTELASPLSEFLGVSIVTGVILYGGGLVLNQEAGLPASHFITYIVLVSQLLNPTKTMITSYTNVQKGLVSGQRILEMLEEPELVKNSANAVEAKEFNDAISVRNISFKYDSEEVIRDVSFEVKKGETVALVGPSGAGKSTLADLICRFYDVDKGEILLDGVNIRDLKINSLRRQMGIVHQESILFNDTIFNNIAFGIPDANVDEVVKAARIANAHEFIDKLDNGYQTKIGERGIALSGGQRQRISIARAVLKNPPILILDEATSSLDTESENLVQEALENLMKTRTSIVIAHRLSTIRNADKIIVIENGGIVEVGTHSELLRDPDGMYKKLSQYQLLDS